MMDIRTAEIIMQSHSLKFGFEYHFCLQIIKVKRREGRGEGAEREGEGEEKEGGKRGRWEESDGKGVDNHTDHQNL